MILYSRVLGVIEDGVPRKGDSTMQGRRMAPCTPVPIAALTRRFYAAVWLLATDAVFPFLVISRSGAAGLVTPWWGF